MDEGRQALRAESRRIGRELEQFATRRALLASPDAAALGDRLQKHLGRVRRYEPRRTGDPGPSGPPRDWLHVVHWNVLQGRHYDRILHAFQVEPALLGADLVSLNEVDLGFARTGDRDVAFELAETLGLHAAWTALFLELETSDKAPSSGVTLESGESLFGLALLSRFPLGTVQRVQLPTPEDFLFDRERRAGHFVALVAEVLHPQGRFHMVVTHLDVHGSPEVRRDQMREIMSVLPGGPVVLAGDLNSTTLRRGSWGPTLQTLGLLALAPVSYLRNRLLTPHLPVGAARESLFEVLRKHGFALEPYNDEGPTLDIHFDDVHELDLLPTRVREAALRALRHVGKRASMRLDWITSRGLAPASERPPFSLPHLMRGDAPASDHAPIGCGLLWSNQS